MPIKGSKSPFRGISRLEEMKKKVSGKNSVHYGKHPSEETRNKMSIAKRGKISLLRGIPRSEEMKKKVRGINNYKYDKPSKYGSESPNWKGGITELNNQIYNCFKYRQWRSDIFTRDNFICQECSIIGKILNAHHKKSFSSILQKYEITTLQEALECEELWNINNGITLCKNCHEKIHANCGVKGAKKERI